VQLRVRGHTSPYHCAPHTQVVGLSSLSHPAAFLAAVRLTATLSLHCRLDEVHPVLRLYEAVSKRSALSEGCMLLNDLALQGAKWNGQTRKMELCGAEEGGRQMHRLPPVLLAFRMHAEECREDEKDGAEQTHSCPLVLNGSHMVELFLVLPTSECVGPCLRAGITVCVDHASVVHKHGVETLALARTRTLRVEAPTPLCSEIAASL